MFNVLTMRRDWVRLGLVLSVCCGGMGCVTPFSGGATHVAFDTSYLVSCRDVTVQKPGEPPSSERIIEAQLPVSVRLLEGAETDVTELLIEVTSPERRIRFNDYLPKTHLESAISGKIKVENNVENSRMLGLKGTLPLVYGATASEDLSANHKNSVKETATKLPPKNAIIVSGTTQNEHGVFFKLKPSTQSTLEGTHQLTFRFGAPAEWRGDWLLLTCRANGKVVAYGATHVQECGRASAYLGLYLNTDASAKEAAEELAQVQEKIAKADPIGTSHAVASVGVFSSVTTKLASHRRVRATAGSAEKSVSSETRAIPPATTHESDLSESDPVESLVLARSQVGRFSGLGSSTANSTIDKGTASSIVPESER